MHGARSSFYYSVPNYDLCTFICMCVGGGGGVGICACVRVCGRACVPMIISSVTGRIVWDAYPADVVIHSLGFL